MAKYKAHRKTWLSHENRLVQEHEIFETEFPDGMKLSDNLECLDKPKRTRQTKTEAPDNTSDTDSGDNNQDGETDANSDGNDDPEQGDA